jgi:hypothetical protein
MPIAAGHNGESTSRARRPVGVTVLTVLTVLLGVVGSAMPASAAEPVVTLGAVSGTFYPNPQNSGVFDSAQLAHPAFRQTFSAIAFNPPSAAGLHCPNAVTVGAGSRPFRDVERFPSGTCYASVAAGNGLKAGVGALASFEATFVTAVHVPSAGDVTL